MSSANKRKGTRWESATRDFLREFPALRHARRVAPEGREDISDVHCWPFALQCKNQRQFKLAEWVRDAEIQAARCEFPYGVAVVKSPGRSTDKGFVVMSLGTFRRLANDHLTGHSDMGRA